MTTTEAKNDIKESFNEAKDSLKEKGSELKHDVQRKTERATDWAGEKAE